MIRPDEGAGSEDHADTVEGTLRQALARADGLPDHTKAVVIFINDAPGTYDVRFNAGGGISASQISTACNYLSALMLRELLDTRPAKVD